MGNDSPRLEQDQISPGWDFAPFLLFPLLLTSLIHRDAFSLPWVGTHGYGGIFFSLGSSVSPRPCWGSQPGPSVGAASPWLSLTECPLSLPRWMGTCARVMESWNGGGWKGP